MATTTGSKILVILLNFDECVPDTLSDSKAYLVPNTQEYLALISDKKEVFRLCHKDEKDDPCEWAQFAVWLPFTFTKDVTVAHVYTLNVTSYRIATTPTNNKQK